MELTAEQWWTFFTIASRHIRGTLKSEVSQWTEPAEEFYRKSYCAWTVFERLGCDTHYWTAELPKETELYEHGVLDGGEWGQPFRFDEIAHLIVPVEYTEDRYVDQKYTMWCHTQDIVGLSRLLDEANIPHKLHETFLELKLY